MSKYSSFVLFSRSIVKHPFFSGSLIMVLGTNFFNVFQFIYHLLVGRLLGKVYYGDLASLISVLGLIAIVQMSLGLTIVKFVASETHKATVANFIKWVHLWSVFISLFFGIFTFIASPFLIAFLNLSQQKIVYLLGPAIFLTVLLGTWRSILQGLLAFRAYVASLLMEGIVKITLTVFFVFAGLAVFGAMSAVLISIVAAFLLTWFPLSIYLRGARGKMPTILPLLRYSFPVFIQGLALTSMYSVDLILVKHFFSPAEAGIYASLAVLGRIVFYGSSPIIQVMFPFVARRYAQKLPYHKIFYWSIFLVLAAVSFVSIFYFFYPTIAISILYGSEYLEGAPILWWFAVFMGLLALAILLTQFYLSIGKTRVVIFFVLAAILQAVLIWFIHTSLLTVIQLSIASVALLVVALLVYFPYHDRKRV